MVLFLFLNRELQDGQLKTAFSTVSGIATQWGWGMESISVRGRWGEMRVKDWRAEFIGASMKGCQVNANIPQKARYSNRPYSSETSDDTTDDAHGSSFDQSHSLVLFLGSDSDDRHCEG